MNWDWDKLKEQQQKQQRSRQQQRPPESETDNKPDDNSWDAYDNPKNDNSGGDWGNDNNSNRGGGWGGGNNRNRTGGSGKSPIPPNLDDMVNKLKKAGGFKPRSLIYLVVIIVLLAIAFTSFYTVNQDEVGVVQRFGRFTGRDRIAQPGLNFKLPFGIETVTKVNVKRIRAMEFGSESRYETTGNAVSLMLTGDLNVALVPWIVQYRVKDPYNYLFKVNDVPRLLSDMSEATMRLIVGDRSINEVISKRAEIAMAAKSLLQQELDRVNCGVEIVTIEMKRTNVPDPVQPSFNEVNQATQEKEQMIYQAREEFNKAIPAARGEAERTILAAQGYALDRVNRAQGDTARFLDLYREYILAKDITRQRLYLEAMQQLLPNLGTKYIIDADQSNLLPFLNMSNQGGAK